MAFRQSTFLVLALAGFGVAAHAQDAARVTNTADSARRQAGLAGNKPAPDDAGATVSLDEFEDVGEQRLLVGKAPHDWFSALADAQAYWTDNAALTENNRVSSDISVISAQAALRLPEIDLAGGELLFSSGYRYQDFYYGALSGRTNHDVNASGIKLDQLNFRTHTGFVRGDWTNAGGWFAGTEGRFTAYISSDSNKTTYQEWSPSVYGGRVVSLGEQDFLTLSADADYRFTHTMFTLGAVGSDLNDRYDLGANFAYAHVFGEHWVIQPSYRFQYSGFTEGAGTTNKSRRDFTHSLTLTAAYVINRNFSLRTYASYEARDSVNAPDDYRAGTVGAGAMASVNF